jgi:hypothetical protein
VNSQNEEDPDDPEWEEILDECEALVKAEQEWEQRESCA